MKPVTLQQHTIRRPCSDFYDKRSKLCLNCIVEAIDINMIYVEPALVGHIVLVPLISTDASVRDMQHVNYYYASQALL